MRYVLQRYVLLIINSLGIWGSVWLASEITGSASFITGFAAFIAVLGVAHMWVDASKESLSHMPDQQRTKKAKRTGGDLATGETDARLAVLLSLMTPEERATFTARMMDEMEGDGEIVSLSDLLESAAEREAAHR